MPKESLPVATPNAVATKSLTNWSALRGYIPEEFNCMTYPPVHKVDISCHTRLRQDVDQVISHITGDHGGGFMMKLRVSDKGCTFWEKLSDAGVEAIDFRCEVCDKQIPFHANHIATHMKAHSGKSRRVRSGGLYNMTLRVGSPRLDEDSAFEQNG